MAYDDELAQRIRALLADEDAVTEKRMFGGLAFLRAGHMTVAASPEGLLARVAPDDTERAIAREHAKPMIMRGSELRGWVHVTPDGVRTDEQLRPWLDEALAFTRALPPKG